MNVLHMISGGDSGGAKTHLFSLLDKLKYKCNVVVACLMRGVFYEEILDKDIETVLFEQKNRLDLSVIGAIKDFLAERKIDILHVHGARANFIALFLKDTLSIPVVTTMHSDYLLDFDTFFKKLIFTNLNIVSLRKIDYFIAVSDMFRDMLIERGFKPNNIHTVYNGMDYADVPSEVISKEEFAQKYSIEYNPDYTYVGIAARFDAVKGVDVFIKGAACALQKNKNLRFIIAGSGVEEENLKNLVKELNIERYVYFLGFIRDMYDFLNFIDINSLTSLCESFPYSMLEGAAMKKPMIASRVGGIPALVKDGETGWLFDSEDTEDFSCKLLHMSEDKEALEYMGNNIYETVTTCFSSENLAANHMEIYNKIIADYGCSTRYDFVLSGYYGFNNSGDDALLLALITDLKSRYPDSRMAVLSSDPQKTQQTYKVDAYKRVSPIRLRKIFKVSNVLLSGGGSLIQDETSSKSLWYYLYVIAWAKRCGMSVMQIASGIGPVRKEFNRKLTSRILNNSVDRITLRENKSYDEVKEMGITVPAQVTVDPAISLEGESRAHIAELFRKNSIPFGDYVCVALRKWKYASEDFEKNVAEAMDYLVRKYQKTVVFIPMQYPVDVAISKNVCSIMKERAYVMDFPVTIRESIGIIQNSSLVVAMRLHSLVYAAAGGVGIIAIKYDPKIDGFMEYFRQSRIAEVSTINAKQLVELIDDYYSSDCSEECMTLCREMKEKSRINAEIAVGLLEKRKDDRKK